jgi:tetratricopeptide (TPR) repeat protein
MNDSTKHTERGQGADDAATPCVGRTRELAQLEAGLASAAAGDGRFFLLVGDAGIGKTCLAAELARRASCRGAGVLQAVGGEIEGAPPHAPWIHLVQTLAAAHPDDPLAPAIAARLAGLTPVALAAVPAAIESERHRLQLEDAVVELLRRAAADGYSLLLFDDLHEADLASLRLLQALVRRLPGLGMTVVATLREANARIARPGQSVFDDLFRRGECVALPAWTSDEVGDRLATWLGRPPPARLVEVVCDVTGGNPLFVDSFARIVRDHADLELLDGFPVGVRIPDSLRAVVRELLRGLPKDVVHLVRSAAVLGQRFSPAVLARLAERSPDTVAAGLEVAATAGILRRPRDGSAAVCFAHPSIRATARADLAAEEIRALHRRAALAQSAVAADSLAASPAVVAHHWLEAAFPADALRAVDAACRAAERAIAACAFDEAAQLYRRALAALGPVADDGMKRCGLLVALVECLVRAGNTQRAREICGEAALLARNLGAGDLLARVALACDDTEGGEDHGDPGIVGYLEESRRWLGRQPGALGALVAARLAVRLTLPGDGARRLALTQEALDTARLCRNDEVLAHALGARHLACRMQNDLGGQLSIAAQMVDAAESCDNRELLLHGLQLRFCNLLEAGDRDAVDGALALYEALASDTPQTVYRFRATLFRAGLSLVEGEFDRARDLAEEARVLGSGEQPLVADICFGLQMMMLERLGGPAGVAEAHVLDLLEAHPTQAVLRLGLAALHADCGRYDEAAAAASRLAASDLRDVPCNGDWLLCVFHAAEVCAVLGDAHLATLLYGLLEPFAGRIAVGAAGALSAGCVSRPLGELAALLGRPAAARAHLEDALARERRLGAVPFAARTERVLAALSPR